ncbi:adenylosuccinate synthetase [bacterium]|nr:adenylosuccinate synthetase [bacterium]
MPVTVVVGGQFGSEGKGKVAHYLAGEMNARIVVRCGGPNSGHTVIDDNGSARIFQQLPTASILPDVMLAICAGSYIDLDILFREIKETKLDAERLIIDPDAVIITEELKSREAQCGLIQKIGSTGSGTGAAVAARINREESLLFAKDIPDLKPYMAKVSDILRNVLDCRERIIIEGTQGFGLSPIHSRLYPYTTSRDTTAAAFIAETGLSPLDVDDVVLTTRAFPIRVAGNSGPLPKETTWDEIKNDSGAPNRLIELTSVTKKIRRVAAFHPQIVNKSIACNKPTRIVLNHLDYIDWSARIGSMSLKVPYFVKKIEKDIESKIDFIGFGPEHLESTSYYLETHIVSNK